jgi:hypothetical protein
MYPDSLLFFLLPVGLYLGLALLPAEPGLPVSLAVLAAAALFLFASAGAPATTVLLERDFQAFFAGGLTGAAAGAVACHRLGRGRAGIWLWRAAGLGIALAATALITVGLIGLVL